MGKKEINGPPPQPSLPAVRHAIVALIAQPPSKRCPHCRKWICGRANGVITPELALKVGQATGVVFRRAGDDRHRVVIGKDTRLSGYMIETALIAGFTSVGMDVLQLGPMPTRRGHAHPLDAGRSRRHDLGVAQSLRR